MKKRFVVVLSLQNKFISSTCTYFICWTPRSEHIFLKKLNSFLPSSGSVLPWVQLTDDLNIACNIPMLAKSFLKTIFESFEPCYRILRSLYLCLNFSTDPHWWHKLQSHLTLILCVQQGLLRLINLHTRTIFFSQNYHREYHRFQTMLFVSPWNNRLDDQKLKFRTVQTALQRC